MNKLNRDLLEECCFSLVGFMDSSVCVLAICIDAFFRLQSQLVYHCRFTFPPITSLCRTGGGGATAKRNKVPLIVLLLSV